MQFRAIFITLLLLFLSLYQGLGQVSYGGTPASFSISEKKLKTIPVISMSPVINEDLLLQDITSKNKNKAYHFAKCFPVDIGLEQQGEWIEYENIRIWRVALISKGAFSMNLIFDKAIFPTGASLFLYTRDHGIIRGAFNANNEQSSGTLPTYPIPGDEIIVEYNEPIDVTYRGQLHISSVNHDFKNAFGTRPMGESGSCNADVYCADGIGMEKEKQSVVVLIVNGTDLCSGTLVNNTKRDKTPYLLTAGHCIETAVQAQRTIVGFNYESPFCGGTSGSANGNAAQSLSGAILRARSDSLDFALVELETMPPPEYRPYYAGWDNSKTVPASTKSIHHPMGDVKKISVDRDPPGISNYGISGYPPNSFWWIKKWDIGTTEAGSSGGPLFSDAKLLIGTLTGGDATCTRSVDDYYAMFGYQWNFMSAANKQLKRWLDPIYSEISKLEAMDPYTSPNVCNQFSNITTGEGYVFQKMNVGKGYISGHNSLRIKEYAQEFKSTEQTTLSAVSFVIGKALAIFNTSKIIIKIYSTEISTGTPGEPLQSFEVSIRSLIKDASNFIVLPNPITIKGKYFVGYEINYNSTADTVAVYHSAKRLNNSNNSAYAKYNNIWQPFYWIPDFNVSTSLLINGYGCASTFVSTNTNPTPEGESRFKIYYPSASASNILYLVNKGVEEYGKIYYYDILGRKVYSTERMLTSTPMELNCSGLASGIYFISVETIAEKEIMKVKIMQTN